MAVKSFQQTGQKKGTAESPTGERQKEQDEGIMKSSMRFTNSMGATPLTAASS